MKIIGIIPARLNSNRIKKKALANIHGMPMCIHVYRRALLNTLLDDLIIATDSKEIISIAKKYNAKTMLTKKIHKNGTERMVEVLKKKKFSIAVLINGDEPMLDPKHINISVKTLVKSNADASILARKFYNYNSPSDFKIVCDRSGFLMYISRADIPFHRNNINTNMLKAYHIMSFRRKIILQYGKLKKTTLEKSEGHEHLRLIENGYKIKVAIVKSNSVSVDVPKDLKYVRSKIKSDKYWHKYK